ncbi:MAG: thiaminase II [Candidatus Lambdaproteobacteria bacterium]|nr:thiaminase II [Candidatus Lambdaproteobacteria bacterium]
MGFCDELRQVSAAIWRAELDHPFVRGIGDGTLDPAKFRFYLEQDYLFLIDYAKVFAIAASRSPDLDTMAYFARLCAETLNEEMALHRSYCGEFGIAPADLEATRPAQTTRGYTGHLLQVAATGGLPEMLAVVLPCQWGYNEVARHLAAQGMPREPRYRRWIAMYASPEFEAYGRWLRARLDGLAAHLAPSDKARLKHIFNLSSRWEYLFWEMAWQRATWAVPEA